MCFQAIVAAVGLLIVAYAKPPGVRYFGLFLAVYGTQANIPSTLAYGQSQTADIAKKGVVAAAMITVGGAGGISGSTIFRAQDAPVSQTPSLFLLTGFLYWIPQTDVDESLTLPIAIHAGYVGHHWNADTLRYRDLRLQHVVEATEQVGR